MKRERIAGSGQEFFLIIGDVDSRRLLVFRGSEEEDLDSDRMTGVTERTPLLSYNSRKHENYVMIT